MAKLTVFSQLQATEHILKYGTASVDATNAVIEYSPAQLISGLVIRTPGASRADTVPSAASVYSYLGSPVKIAGASFDFTIRNAAGAAHTITLTQDSGTTVTLSGTMTIAQNNSKTFRWVFTSPTAATVYSLGTVVH